MVRPTQNLVIPRLFKHPQTTLPAQCLSDASLGWSRHRSMALSGAESVVLFASRDSFLPEVGG